MAAKTGSKNKRFTKVDIYVIISKFTHEVIMKFGFTPEAEILNARLAMLGFVIAVGTYLTTGQIIPGVL
jgi:hypothetical protein